METLRREHFNRWYHLIPYYFSIILFEIPFQVRNPYVFMDCILILKKMSNKPMFFLVFQLMCTFIFVCGSYFLTGNYVPGQNNRFMLFTLMCLLATISAQSWGFFIGSTMPIKVRKNRWTGSFEVQFRFFLKQFFLENNLDF